MAIDRIKIFSNSTPASVEQDVNNFLAQFQGQVCNVSFTAERDISVHNVMVHFREKQKQEPEDELTEEDRISNGETLERALGL